MKVYIAGASTEIDRAKRCAYALEGLGIDVVSTWVDSVEEEGGSNLESFDLIKRRDIAYRCVREMAAADWIWVLVPEGNAYSHGAMWEMGASYNAGKPIVCSGPTWRSVFCSLVMEFRFDEAAIAHFVQVKR